MKRADRLIKMIDWCACRGYILSFDYMYQNTNCVVVRDAWLTAREFFVKYHGATLFVIGHGKKAEKAMWRLMRGKPALRVKK